MHKWLSDFDLIARSESAEMPCHSLKPYLELDAGVFRGQPRSGRGSLLGRLLPYDGKEPTAHCAPATINVPWNSGDQVISRPESVSGRDFFQGNLAGENNGGRAAILVSGRDLTFREKHSDFRKSRQHRPVPLREEEDHRGDGQCS
jgi:hypothetical protein